MIKPIQIRVTPECAAKKKFLINRISNEFNIAKNDIKDINILKKSIDARQKQIKINLKIDVYINQKFIEHSKTRKYKNLLKKSKKANTKMSMNLKK